MNNSEIILLVSCAIATLLIALALGPVFIPVLHRLKFGQKIREIGPSWHKKKSGTPTMGGFIFIIPVIVAMLIFVRTKTALYLTGFSFLFGCIGFVDDFIKVILKRNLGLNEKQKLALQLIASVLFVVVGLKLNIIDTSIIVPFAKQVVNFGWLYIPFAIFVTVGTSNSVNLTDGVDGLAATVTVVVCAFLTIVACKTSNYDIAAFCVANAFGCLGFLAFNHHPAKVFMGDTGSLYLGGVVCSVAIALKLPLVLIIAGGVYVLETLSVIIQVTSFKLTGNRVFKMSPIHHHFEMLGWNECKIVTIAALVSALLCVISYFAA